MHRLSYFVAGMCVVLAIYSFRTLDWPWFWFGVFGLLVNVICGYLEERKGDG